MKRALLAAALLSSACVSMGGVGGARTLVAGASEFSIGPELSLSRTSTSRLPALELAAGYRRGLGEHVDASLRGWGIAASNGAAASYGAGATVKVQLVDAAEGRSFDLAVAPGLAYHQFDAGGTATRVVAASLPLVFGKRVGAASQLYGGPRLGYDVVFGESMKTQNMALAGVGFGADLAFTEHFRLRPELVLMWSPITVSGEVGGKTGTTLTQLSLGATWLW